MIATGASAANAELMTNAVAVRGRSLWVDARGRLLRNKAAVVSMIVLAIIALAAVFLPLVWPYAYDEIDYTLTQRRRIEDFERRREADPALFIQSTERKAFPT